MDEHRLEGVIASDLSPGRCTGDFEPSLLLEVSSAPAERRSIRVIFVGEAARAAEHAAQDAELVGRKLVAWGNFEGPNPGSSDEASDRGSKAFVATRLELPGRPD